MLRAESRLLHSPVFRQRRATFNGSLSQAALTQAKRLKWRAFQQDALPKMLLTMATLGSDRMFAQVRLLQHRLLR
jgi:hypothetical protein